MTKQDFITDLEQHLIQLAQLEKEHVLNFYNETIEDRIEDGMSEEEAIQSLGSVEDIAAQVLSEREDRSMETINLPKKDHRTLRILLLVIGFPIWSMMLVAAFLLYLSIWMLILSLAILVVCLVLFLLLGLWNLYSILKANTAAGVVIIGTLLLVIGLIPLLCMGFKKSALWMKKNTIVWGGMLKRMFIKVVS